MYLHRSSSQKPARRAEVLPRRRKSITTKPHRHPNSSAPIPQSSRSRRLQSEPHLTMSAPLFWSTPLKYCSWAARERPAFFWSVVVGAAGPILIPIVPPIRHMLGDVDPAPIPVTYPVPAGPRKQVTGYDD
ncbi:uncharacterized protein TrAtP1_012152 [Trichoderma atroviride]|nr:hypothetical protein TrAtP1_012152 [Trichoderma atroviride]